MEYALAGAATSTSPTATNPATTTARTSGSPRQLRGNTIGIRPANIGTRDAHARALPAVCPCADSLYAAGIAVEARERVRAHVEAAERAAGAPRPGSSGDVRAAAGAGGDRAIGGEPPRTHGRRRALARAGRRGVSGGAHARAAARDRRRLVEAGRWQLRRQRAFGRRDRLRSPQGRPLGQAGRRRRMT